MNTKCSKRKRRNPVARAMAVLGKVGGRHPDKRAEASRRGCRGKVRA